MADNRLYKTELEVSEFFIFKSDTPISQRLKKNGILIDSKLRREILTGGNSGKVAINGMVENYIFTNLSGGVWRVTVSDSRK